MDDERLFCITFVTSQAEAIWVSLRPIVEKKVEEGVEKFYFVSDSPVNQYR